MDRLQVGQFIVVCIDAHAKVQSGIPSIDDLVIAVLHTLTSTSYYDSARHTHLNKITLVLLVTGRDETVDLALETDLLVVVKWHIELG